MVNATTWLGPLMIVIPMYGFVMPFLMIINIISNLIIILVLTR